jgi:hypothetical protein
LDQAPDPDPDVHNAPFSIKKIQILFVFAPPKTTLKFFSSEQTNIIKFKKIITLVTLLLMMFASFFAN